MEEYKLSILDRGVRKSFKLILDFNHGVWKYIGLYNLFNKTIYSGLRNKKAEKILNIISQIDYKNLSTDNWKSVLKKTLKFCWDKNKCDFEVFINIIESLPQYGKKNLLYEEALQEMMMDELINDKKLDILQFILKEDNLLFKDTFIKVFSEAFRSISDDKNKFEELVNKINIILENENDIERKIGIYSLILRSGAVGADFLKRYINILRTIKVSDNSIKYFSAVFEIPWLNFIYPENIYDEFYSDHRELLKDIANEINVNTNIKAKKKDLPEINNNIAIIANGLHTKKHASTRLIVGVANELSRRGYNVNIFIADGNFRGNDEEYLIAPLATRTNNSEIFQEQHKEIIFSQVGIEYSVEDNLFDRFNNYIEKINKFDPKYIIDICWENAVFNHILINKYPIIKVPLGGLCTSSVFDNYIVRDLEQLKIENKIYKVIDEDKICEGNIYIPYPVNSTKIVNRCNYEIEDDDFVMVTVGNRLAYELKEDFIQEATNLLKENEKLKWIIVGPAVKIYSCMKKYLKNKQIILISYENELAALYNICDVFLNPIRVGGGGSIALAVQYGLVATVSNKTSDILPFLGKENCLDGGNKEIFDFIRRIMNDKNLYLEISEKMKSNLLSEKFSTSAYVDIIENAYSEIKK